MPDDSLPDPNSDKTLGPGSGANPSETDATYRRATDGGTAEPGLFSRGALPRGAQVGRYLVLGVVGEGGMGRVYDAYDPQLDRRLALKLMLVGGDPLNKPRMLREAKAMARVSHPNVVAVHDAGEVEDQVFVAMDLIDGTTLGKWLKAKPRPTSEILATFRRAGEGLAAAHAAGIVHRDFKPANVLIGNKGQVAVTDFGLARETATRDATAALPIEFAGELRTGDSQTLEPLTQAGVVSGTPQYMAPEQFAGAATDARADQFAFCVALWDALYGQPPYPARTVQDLVNRIARGDLAQPSDRKKVPAHIHRALERGLSPRAEQRYPSMEALLREISQDTGRGTRRLQWAAIVLLSSAVAGLGWYRLSGARQRACTSSLQRFSAVWTPQARETVRGAFEAALPNLGVETYASVESALETWVDNWKDTQRAVCASNAGQLFDNRVERQLGCLDELRMSEVALVGALGRVDRSSAEAAIDAVLSLSPPRECATEQARPANAPDVRAEIRARVAEGRVLTWMLKPKEGEAKALEAVALAQKAALPDEESLAWMQVGASRGMNSRFDEAEAATVEAIHCAERAGDQRTVANAWADRMFVAASYESQWQKAWEAGQHALAIAGQFGGDRLLTTKVQALEGLILVQTGKPGEALAPLREALQAAEKAQGPESLGLVRILLLLTNAARNAGNLDEALDATERAIKIQDRHLPKIHLARAAVLNARGRVMFSAGRNGEALALHKKAREMLEATLPNVYIELTKTLAMIGEVQRADKDLAGARATFQEALVQAATFAPPTHLLRASLERDLGRLAASTGDEREAAESFERSLQGPWEKSERVKIWQALAQARLNLNEANAAAAAARSGLELDALPSLHFLLAQSDWALGDKAASKLELQKAATGADADLKAEIERWSAANTAPPRRNRKN